MWKPFLHDCNNYLIKVNYSGVTVFVTNLDKMWQETVATETLLEKFNVANPFLDCDSISVIRHLSSLVENIMEPGSVVSLSIVSDEIILKLCSKMEELSIKYTFNLSLADAHTFKNEFMVPMVKTIQSLELIQQQLCDLLEKKDREIDEHRMEGGDITRSYLKTDAFDRNAFLSNTPDQLLMNTFSKKEFYDTFVKKYGGIEKYANIVERDQSKRIKRAKRKTEKRK